MGEAVTLLFLVFIGLQIGIVAPLDDDGTGFFFLDLDLFGNFAEGVLDDGELFVEVGGAEPFTHDGFDLAHAFGIALEVGWFGAKADGDLVEEVDVARSTGAIDAGVVLFE